LFAYYFEDLFYGSLWINKKVDGIGSSIGDLNGGTGSIGTVFCCLRRRRTDI
jgi:hypothetical protein